MCRLGRALAARAGKCVALDWRGGGGARSGQQQPLGHLRLLESPDQVRTLCLWQRRNFAAHLQSGVGAAEAGRADHQLLQRLVGAPCLQRVRSSGWQRREFSIWFPARTTGQTCTWIVNDLVVPDFAAGRRADDGGDGVGGRVAEADEEGTDRAVLEQRGGLGDRERAVKPASRTVSAAQQTFLEGRQRTAGARAGGA